MEKIKEKRIMTHHKDRTYEYVYVSSIKRFGFFPTIIGKMTEDWHDNMMRFSIISYAINHSRSISRIQLHIPMKHIYEYDTIQIRKYIHLSKIKI